ncbi:RNA polymerase subunit sigma-54 [Tropicibacter alexandrii]|uniref:RNA polymerase factor sigma-54 n=1 Tax=Tropicibacter alexandrii TaxID=2267683 RepID=UPI000EF534E5|nr:RNA polymerase subunit sigma-54 [Tropicibacter alexandrii]
MTLSTRLHPSQTQSFRLGHVTHVLQMSGEELDDHLYRTARENPLLIVRQRRYTAIRAGSAADLIDAGMANRPTSLYDHVLHELAGLIGHGGPMERLILGLVEELEPSGWIGRPVPEIADNLGLACHLVETALALVQRRVSPAGLFARDLAECLRLQLKDKELWDAEAEAVLAHLPALERGGPAALARAAGLDDATVAAQLARLRRLDPKPGGQFAADPTLMRAPDVRIEPDGDGWRAVFTSRFATEVAVLPRAEADVSPDLRQALGEARALKQAMDLRHNALKHIVQVIIDVQGAFFRGGPEALKPLTQATIAQRTGFHISTVSRVLNGLLIEGPNGIVEARTLCPRPSARGGAGGAAKPRVIARLRALLAAEMPDAPLSDQQLADRLGREGLRVSRRVVAKYRQELGFAPVAQRRLRA